MLIVVAAPGNQFRQGVVGAFPGPVRVISFSFRNAAFIYGKFYLKTPFWALFSTILPFLTGWLFYMPTAAATLNQSSHNWWRDSWLRSLVLLGLASFILVAAACAPVVYALNAYPDDRTIIIPQFVIIAAVIAGSALLGAGLRHANILPNPLKRPGLGQTLQIGIMAALLLCAGYSTWQTVTQIPDFQAYALAWDQRAVIIQQAAFSGQAELTVVGLNARFGVADLNADPGYWVNQCMASYYHILTLRGR